MSEVEIQVSRLVFLALSVTLLDKLKLKTYLKPLMIRSRGERVRVKKCTLT